MSDMVIYWICAAVMLLVNFNTLGKAYRYFEVAKMRSGSDEEVGFWVLGVLLTFGAAALWPAALVLHPAIWLFNHARNREPSSIKLRKDLKQANAANAKLTAELTAARDTIVAKNEELNLMAMNVLASYPLTTNTTKPQTPQD